MIGNWLRQPLAATNASSCIHCFTVTVVYIGEETAGAILTTELAMPPTSVRVNVAAGAAPC